MSLRLMEKNVVNISDCKNHNMLTSDINEYPNLQKLSFNLENNNFDPSKGNDICKLQTKNGDHSALYKRIANTNEKKYVLQKEKAAIKKNHAWSRITSTNNRIKYPNYLKSSSKILSNHVCKAKNISPSKTKYRLKQSESAIRNNKYAANETNPTKNQELRHTEEIIEELKDKIKMVVEFQQEITDKVEKIEKKLMLLKKEVDCVKQPMNNQDYESKLLELGHSYLYEINKSFVNIFDCKLNSSSEKMNLKSINSMISWQRTALQEQKENIMQGLFEIGKFLNENYK